MHHVMCTPTVLRPFLKMKGWAKIIKIEQLQITNSNDILELDSEWGNEPPEPLLPLTSFDSNVFAQFTKKWKHICVDIPKMYKLSLLYVNISFSRWLKLFLKFYLLTQYFVKSIWQIAIYLIYYKVIKIM